MATAPHSILGNAIDIETWLQKIMAQYHLSDVSLLSKAALFVQQQVAANTCDISALNQGMLIAETLLELNLDQYTIAAGLLSALSLNEQLTELMHESLDTTVAKLAIGVQQMSTFSFLQPRENRTKTQIDKSRKMLLAMAQDIRVVVIKLAERLRFMQAIKSMPQEERQAHAQEILDIYAPLANRLGIGQLKWELEDIAFHYQNPVAYKTIATFLSEKRIAREQRIQQLINHLSEQLASSHIDAKVTGRAKHIYSIYLKSIRKKVDYENLYDHTALRILVKSIDDCYAALSVVHNLWQPIIEEFDDYIANPKANGYRSIHTAVIDEDAKHFEIQIRTWDIHEEAERGVAAHWIYKENNAHSANHSEKINYLRQLLDWHKEISSTDTPDPIINDEQVYVTTPGGDILDLPQGATPVDFAYALHTELGHHCRGAKVNAQIVPLNYALQTGDRVEIISTLQGGPSRDWLNPEYGYIKTSRARSKVTHWFKQQALEEDIETGRTILEKELARSGLAKTVSLATITRHLQLKDEAALLIGLGRGNIRIGQILQALQPKEADKTPTFTSVTTTELIEEHHEAFAGVSNLLTRVARCCKPIPGDAIFGYITQGRGISIHKKICKNVKSLTNPNRVISIDWNKDHTHAFSTDLKIIAHDQGKTLTDLTALFANEKINVLNCHTATYQNQDRIIIFVTVKVQSVEQLNRLIHRIQQLPDVVEVVR